MIDKWHISVIIPAKDEQELLPRCLHSVLYACQLVSTVATTDVVIVVDDSVDDTYALASELVSDYGVAVSRSYSCVGMARAHAVLQALKRTPAPKSKCWLANTDADCVVPSNWLLQQIEFAQLGWHGVAGIIDVDSFAEHDEDVSGRFTESYHVHSDGTHPHVHGANLGVRADAYIGAGGWSPLVTGEDHDLWKRLTKGHYRLKSDSALKVSTSGRRVGRAPLGFADALAAHNRPSI